MPFPDGTHCTIDFKPPFVGNGRLMTQGHFLPLCSLKNKCYFHACDLLVLVSVLLLARRSGCPVPVFPPPSSSRACPRLAVAALFIPKRKGGQSRFHLEQTCRRSPPSSSSSDAVDTPSSPSPAVLLPRVYPPYRGRALHTEKKRWSESVSS